LIFYFRISGVFPKRSYQKNIFHLLPDSPKSLSPMEPSEKESCVYLILNKETREFTAKTINDLGKNIVTVGFASYFFKDLPLLMRIGIAILGLGLILWSIYLMSQKGVK